MCVPAEEHALSILRCLSSSRWVCALPSAHHHYPTTAPFTTPTTTTPTATATPQFFIQGDAEKQLRLPVSPLYDRDKPGISKSQIGFFEFVVFPLYRSFMTVFPGCRPMMAGVDANFMWVHLGGARTRAHTCVVYVCVQRGASAGIKTMYAHTVSVVMGLPIPNQHSGQDSMLREGVHCSPSA